MNIDPAAVTVVAARAQGYAGVPFHVPEPVVPTQDGVTVAPTQDGVYTVISNVIMLSITARDEHCIHVFLKSLIILVRKCARSSLTLVRYVWNVRQGLSQLQD